jgi:F420 biosynthesis protein FbiB-like protein
MGYNRFMSASDPFWRTVFDRRSVRRYSDQPVPRALLERLLTAAIWAPNAHNRQPWRFAVVTQVETQRRLAEAMADRWQHDLLADGADPVFAGRRAAISRQRIGEAGAVVLGCLTMTVMDHYPDRERQRLEGLMAAQSLALALGQLLLAAHHEGLAGCWMCAPLFVPELVRQTLDLPPDWEPQALITLGYPAETRTSARLPLDDVVIWR